MYVCMHVYKNKLYIYIYIYIYISFFIPCGILWRRVAGFESAGSRDTNPQDFCEQVRARTVQRLETVCKWPEKEDRPHPNS